MSLTLRPSDENSLVFVDGSWWGTLKYAVILLLAYPAFLAAMYIFHGREKSLGLLGGVLMLYVMGAVIFGSFSLLKSFGRSGWHFDRRERTAVSWKGILSPWFRKHYRCDEFKFVSLNCHTIKRGYAYQFFCSVRLNGEGEAHVLFGEWPQLAQARSVANALVRFLQLPLLDAVGETPRLMSPAEVDLSLRGKQQASRGAADQ